MRGISVMMTPLLPGNKGELTPREHCTEASLFCIVPVNYTRVTTFLVHFSGACEQVGFSCFPVNSSVCSDCCVYFVSVPVLGSPELLLVPLHALPKKPNLSSGTVHREFFSSLALPHTWTYSYVFVRQGIQSMSCCYRYWQDVHRTGTV